MAKKADLQRQAKKLGIDVEGMRVADLEAAIEHVQTAVEEVSQPVADAPTDAPAPVEVAGGGPHAAHAYGTSQGVHLQLGHMEHNADGNAEFHLASEFVLGRDAALALADELPGAAADHNAVGSHFG